MCINVTEGPWSQVMKNNPVHLSTVFLLQLLFLSFVGLGLATSPVIEW